MELHNSKAVTVYLEAGQYNVTGIPVLRILSSSITEAGHDIHVSQTFTDNLNRGRLQYSHPAKSKRHRQNVMNNIRNELASNSELLKKILRIREEKSATTSVSLVCIEIIEPV